MIDPFAVMALDRERLVVRWQREAIKLIRSKLEDAEAHAEKALTDTLKATPDGRHTIRKASRSPSYAAAVSRLDELLTALAGPSKASLEGLIRRARVDFMFAGMSLWLPFVPTALLASSDPRPTTAQLENACRLVLHGMELRDEIGAPIATAKRKLLATLAQAGARSTPDRIASDLLKTWRRQTETILIGAVKRAISDSEVRLNVIAGRALVHADYLDDTPIAAGDSP